jgi:hypothetical protein
MVKFSLGRSARCSWPRQMLAARDAGLWFFAGGCGAFATVWDSAWRAGLPCAKALAQASGFSA